jgi:hypothetical protein
MILKKLDSNKYPCLFCFSTERIIEIKTHNNCVIHICDKCAALLHKEIDTAYKIQGFK